MGSPSGPGVAFPHQCSASHTALALTGFLSQDSTVFRYVREPHCRERQLLHQHLHLKGPMELSFTIYDPLPSTPIPRRQTWLGLWSLLRRCRRKVRQQPARSRGWTQDPTAMATTEVGRMEVLGSTALGRDCTGLGFLVCCERLAEPQPPGHCPWLRSGRLSSRRWDFLTAVCSS